MTEQRSWDDNVAFTLVRLGHLADRRFAEKLAAVGMRPRQVGVLEQLQAGPLSQLDLARALRVTPSVVVDMADDLTELGAIQRVRDTHDRRRQNLRLTPRGRALARRALQAATEVDAELLAGLDAGQLDGLRAALRQVSADHGLGRTR